MSKQQSVAPKERVNITYKSATGDATEQKELPLKILALGDYTGRADQTPVEERKPINISKDNFTEVLKAHQLEVQFDVPDKLTQQPGAELAVSLKLSSLKDFEPEGIVQQVPELKKLLELREALTALKAPLASRRHFRERLAELLADDTTRATLLQQLGAGDDKAKE